MLSVCFHVYLYLCICSFIYGYTTDIIYSHFILFLLFAHHFHLLLLSIYESVPFHKHSVMQIAQNRLYLLWPLDPPPSLLSIFLPYFYCLFLLFHCSSLHILIPLLSLGSLTPYRYFSSFPLLLPTSPGILLSAFLASPCIAVPGPSLAQTFFSVAPPYHLLRYLAFLFLYLILSVFVFVFSPSTSLFFNRRRNI